MVAETGVASKLMTDFSQQVSVGGANSHKRPVDWAGDENARTAVEPEEEREGDVSLSKRESEWDTNADLMEQERGGKQSCVGQMRSGAEVPLRNGSGEQEEGADIWYDADRDTSPEMLPHPATT
ncbi:hypothetical protein NDU88_004996 [Pleurodeles waltl]|uniref:Uncharacterized protein n=1 Tax=Pleurodeles waltl TaxID=8319 RepID=A0AAV7MW66_PLEWA|nr:hypothetical protein NDU88_004996 [Pleurodeles waltl]